MIEQTPALNEPPGRSGEPRATPPTRAASRLARFGDKGDIHEDKAVVRVFG
jgi:hypothetical protein